MSLDNMQLLRYHTAYWSWSRSRSHITTDSQSASQSWCQAPIWESGNFLRQFRFCNFVAPSLTRGRVCNLLCTSASKPCQNSHSLVEAPQISRPYWCLSIVVHVDWSHTSLGAGFPTAHPLQKGHKWRFIAIPHLALFSLISSFHPHTLRRISIKFGNGVYTENNWALIFIHIRP
jgi:hypothetical protein